MNVERWAQLPDEDKAQLPFAESQLMLAGVPLRGTARYATVEWHGTSTDTVRGAVVLARAGSAAEELVGDRLRLTRPGRVPIFVYCHRATDDLDADLSVPRQLFARFSDLAAAEAAVLVEVVG